MILPSIIRPTRWLASSMAGRISAPFLPRFCAVFGSCQFSLPLAAYRLPPASSRRAPKAGDKKCHPHFLRFVSSCLRVFVVPRPFPILPMTFPEISNLGNVW